ncbi:uncharacterized protein LY89DRAFT_724539 [Mollisia scopiformis]|uniref:ABM domain-containing protein n=1 Tax=Mollisia scopiformis TaxID=149040 RepID=A0A132B9R4_MOLSC|nr:uncharacterized protein LY89DRAFT_724539 [Mollisia scopiformis]KUJ08983.1 hypothetical protein LY89DRAFT_724539 [Mollisia scopiformis]
MPLTEIGLMGVKPNHPIMDDSHPSGKIFTNVYTSIYAAPNSPREIYWGLELEDPLHVWAFFEWESLDAHKDFAKSFGAEAVQDFPKVLTHGEFSKHVEIRPTLSPLRAPVTQIVTAFLPAEMAGEARERVEGLVERVVRGLRGGGGGVQGVSFGWGVEDDFPVRGEVGGMGKVLVLLVGWESVERCQWFRETGAFKENLGLLRGLEGLVKLDVVHVKCRGLWGKKE